MRPFRYCTPPVAVLVLHEDAVERFGVVNMKPGRLPCAASMSRTN